MVVVMMEGGVGASSVAAGRGSLVVATSTTLPGVPSRAPSSPRLNACCSSRAAAAAATVSRVGEGGREASSATGSTVRSPVNAPPPRREPSREVLRPPRREPSREEGQGGVAVAESRRVKAALCEECGLEKTRQTKRRSTYWHALTRFGPAAAPAVPPQRETACVSTVSEGNAWRRRPGNRPGRPCRRVGGHSARRVRLVPPPPPHNSLPHRHATDTQNPHTPANA